MNETLTEEQILLLENLTYITTPDGQNFMDLANENYKTVGEMLQEISLSDYEFDNDYGSCITGRDWTNIINAIKADKTLCEMNIVEVHKDSGDGVSALFLSDSGEAVVAYRGTAKAEWGDNFLGGGSTFSTDHVSTPQQEAALDWYQDVYNRYNLDDYYITVTGHSKGGNKAKYITILDDTVDRCISFDGQGFSDEFIEMYGILISDRQDKIDNYNLESDFVNILLNDVGRKHYIVGQEIQAFVENHAPNSFFAYDENGKPYMVEGKQNESMAMLDEFVNSYLRTLPPEEKRKALLLIGKIVQGLFEGQDMDYFTDLCFFGNNSYHTMYLLSYLAKYIKENPDFGKNIKDILCTYGMEKYVSVIEGMEWLVENIPNWFLSGIARMVSLLPDKIIHFIRDLIKEKIGIELTESQIRKLLEMLADSQSIIGNICVPNGNDIHVSDVDFFVDVVETFAEGFLTSIGNVFPTFFVNTKGLHEAANIMENCIAMLSKYKNSIVYITEIGSSQQKINAYISLIENAVISECENCKKLANGLFEIEARYKEAEYGIMTR